MPVWQKIESGMGWIVVAVGLAELSRGAFGTKARKKILERDGHVSAESGEEGTLEVAHYNHNKAQPGHNDLSNGRALTPSEHYADHFNRDATAGLGLSQEQNRMALESIWQRLTPEERARLPKPDEVGQDFIPRKEKKRG